MDTKYFRQNGTMGRYVFISSPQAAGTMIFTYVVHVIHATYIGLCNNVYIKTPIPGREKTARLHLCSTEEIVWDTYKVMYIDEAIRRTDIRKHTHTMDNVIYIVVDF